MKYDIYLSEVEAFAGYAGNELRLWKKAEGKKVEHAARGKGVIEEVYVTNGASATD
jgi:hypothetical protein